MDPGNSDGAPAFGAVDLREVRAALALVSARLVTLIRTIDDPQAHAVGEWSAGDVALHLIDVWEKLPALARREIPSILDDVWDLGQVTTSLVKSKAGRGPADAARFVEAATDEFLSATAGATGDEMAPWLLKGVEVPLSAFACHLLSESLVHGDDIARSQGRSWTIEPDHAALVLRGFVMSVIPKLDPRTIVIEERAAGVDVCYDVLLRGGRGRVFLRVADGMLTIADDPPRRVDCHISADPVTLLLVFFGRRGPWSAFGRGGIIAWGRKPWVAQKMRTLVRNP